MEEVDWLKPPRLKSPEELEAMGYISNQKPMSRGYKPSRAEMEIGEGPNFDV